MAHDATRRYASVAFEVRTNVTIKLRLVCKKDTNKIGSAISKGLQYIFGNSPTAHKNLEKITYTFIN